MSGVIADPGLLQVYEYWSSKRRGRPMPSRTDLDPTELPGRLWPHIMLIDVVRQDAGVRFRYRRIGSHFVQAFGGDATGKFLDDELPAEYGYRDYVLGIYREVATAHHPLYTENTFALKGQAVPMLTKRVSLPLSSNGVEVDIALASHVFVSPRNVAGNFNPLLDGFAEVKRVVLD